MARLQDFSTVTPSLDDNLLIVQSQGQGLAQLKNIAVNNLNGTISSGGTIRSILVDTSIPKGVYFYQTQNASDNPESSTLTTTMIYKNNANGNHSRIYAFCGNNIYYTNTTSSVPSSLSWSKTNSWNMLLNEALSNADKTYSINYGSQEPNEIMFVLMNTTNSRVISTTIVPFGTFLNGGAYVYGASNLAGTELYSAVFIYTDSTHIEIARGSATNLRARVFVR